MGMEALRYSSSSVLLGLRLLEEHLFKQPLFTLGQVRRDPDRMMKKSWEEDFR
jgi:hypothetical protein